MNKIILDKKSLIEEMDNTQSQRSYFYIVLCLTGFILLFFALRYCSGEKMEAIVMLLWFLPFEVIFFLIFLFGKKENIKIKNLIIEGKYNIYEEFVEDKKIKYISKYGNYFLKLSGSKKYVAVEKKMYKKVSIGDNCYVFQFKICTYTERKFFLSNEYDLSPELREKIICNK